ncbi:hypothetical protein PIB30_005785 [Stylosanthes scabra]|uniref:Uncharacterized protein n=1 Tax=Stylosanthes scabra TaxID=79078 RepID=A0ABU6X2V6_9FABA|nr:hypothetical protein [Stylosanthes scabra]
MSTALRPRRRTRTHSSRNPNPLYKAPPVVKEKNEAETARRLDEQVRREAPTVMKEMKAAETAERLDEQIWRETRNRDTRLTPMEDGGNDSPDGGFRKVLRRRSWLRTSEEDDGFQKFQNGNNGFANGDRGRRGQSEVEDDSDFEASRKLSLNSWNRGAGSGFVRMSATCSARWTAERLSQKTVGGCREGCLSSKRRFWTHWTSVKLAASARYSTSVELRLTMFCFVHFQDTRFEPKNIQKRVVVLPNPKFCDKEGAGAVFVTCSTLGGRLPVLDLADIGCVLVLGRVAGEEGVGSGRLISIPEIGIGPLAVVDGRLGAGTTMVEGS